VAWVNAADAGALHGGLAEVAAALGLGTGSNEDAGLVVRHCLETGGERCLLVFENADDPDYLRPFVPAAGAARMLITSTRQSVANLGVGVPVDVFAEDEALAFQAERTGSDDSAGARVLAAELGRLPLALAQAAAVIIGQHLGYDVYRQRLRSMPVDALLTPVQAGQYPHGLAAAVLLSLDLARAGDDGETCGAVMELVSMLSPSGVGRTLMHAAGHSGALAGHGRDGEVRAEVVGAVLGRLAGSSLLTFSVDGGSVSAHRSDDARGPGTARCPGTTRGGLLGGCEARCKLRLRRSSGHMAGADRSQRPGWPDRSLARELDVVSGRAGQRSQPGHGDLAMVGCLVP
jgi:hypothetical protein